MEPLFSKKLAKQSPASSTQEFLDVAEIKEDTILLKNGSIRSILSVSAINFDLKSTEEQEAIVMQYQNFINSLDFPVQILITSRKINMDKYLSFIEKKEKLQNNELLKFQIMEYQNFIRHLISVSNIMEKNFYIIVPFSPVENSERGFFDNFFNMLNPKKNIIEKRETFETYKNQLFQRNDMIISGLSGVGLKFEVLKTQELIELLYNAYNPDVHTPTEITDVTGLDLRN